VAAITMTKKLPKHEEIRIELESKMRSDTYKAGSKLPPEIELSAEYNVSRSTIRQALRSLEEKGLINRKSGHGTTVMPIINTEIQKLSSFSEDMLSRGYVPSGKLLDIQLVDAPEYVQEAFKIKDKKVWYLKRLRFADDKVIALQLLFIPPYLPIELQDLLDMESYYELLESKLNIKVHSATETLSARKAKNEEVKLLKTKDTVIEFDRITYSNDAKCVEYIRGIYLASQYKYQFKLIRDN
jgi:GntR family transcriptional regulator